MKAAFVIPWYGADIPGGAEAECRRTAEELVKRGAEVEVLTTCLHSLGESWERNHHPPGETRVNGVTVKRFPIRPRDVDLFDQVNIRLIDGQTVPPALERTMLENMVNSPGLYDYIASASQRVFFPIPYLFSTTVKTAQIAPDRCVPIACLHDEVYAYMEPIRKALLASRGVIFHTEAEYRLARDIMDFPAERALIYGEGVETDIAGDGERFRQRYGIEAPFMLYAGRRDRTKNTPLLLDYFARYKRSRPTKLKLVLMGNQDFDTPEGLEAEVIDVGFLSAQDKADAYAAADIFCQPSVNESFSLVIMEAWLCRTPVLVHGECEATREHVEKNGGGLTFTDFDEFAAAVDALLADPKAAAGMAERGREYVLENFRWETICRRYLALLADAEVKTGVFAEPRRPRRPAVHQVLADFRPGEPASDEARLIRDRLHREGVEGGLYAPGRDFGLRRLCRPLPRLTEHVEPGDVLIWHYTAGEGIPDVLVELGRPRLLRLHGGRPEGNSLLGLERQGAFNLVLNRVELVVTEWEGVKSESARTEGPKAVAVRPMIDPARIAEPRAEATLAGEGPNLLYVGPLTPPARIEEIVKAFYFLKRLKPAATLTLAGLALEGEAYLQAVSGLIAELEVTGAAIVPPHPPEELAARYAAADCFLCLGQVADGGRAMIEAMVRGLPVIAAAEGIAPEVLGRAGVILDKAEPAAAAEAVGLIFDDPSSREAVLAAQRDRLAELRPEAVWPQWRRLLEPFYAGGREDR